ncbi:chromosome partitioning protein [Kutzneria sp. NPDC051319]|uniref:chromosome partitioning protein n=1 Tax=Kutzneria sp. NPDC051319 TaxID=3155047 RepID=UPI00342FF6A6
MLVTVVSVKGAPGVTTFAVALAARWPAPYRPVLVEADPSGGDLAARFSLESAPGLLTLAAAARRSGDPALVWQHAQAMPGGMPVLAAPPDADRARGALSALTADPTAGAGVVRAAANMPDTVLIVDCGRVDVGSPAMPIVRASDAMILLTGGHGDDLAHLARRLPAIGRWSARPVLLLVGDGYSPAEVARELGVAPMGRVPDDPQGAGVLCGRPSGKPWRRSGPAHSPLGQFAHAVAAQLAAQQAPVALPHQAAAQSRPVPVLRSVPGVPDSPVAVQGVRSAPLPQGLLPFTNTSPRGGAVS